MTAQIPHLEEIVEFQKVLENYKISDEEKSFLANIKLVLMLAPSSTGRNTIIRQLVGTGEYKFIVSDTTRPPRINDGLLEQNGIEYWFRTEDEVLEDLKTGKFLEAELLHGQQVSGISMRELKNAYDHGKISITDVDLAGIENVMKLKPDTVSILVLPPSFKEWQRRFTERGAMSDEERRRRIETAHRIFTNALQHDDLYYVINKNIHDAAIEINELAHGIKEHPERQKEGKALIEELCKNTKIFLDKTK